MTLFGWDASGFDWSRGPVSLAAAYADGIRMFTHKATEGTRVRHTQFGEAMSRARAVSMPYVGAYIVPRTPGNGGHGTVAAQVKYFLDYVSASAPWWREYPGWFWQVDLEHWSNSGGVYDAVSPAVGLETCNRLEDTGWPVVLYAPEWAYGDSIGGSVPLWESQYGSNPAVPYRQAYPGDSSSRWKPYSGRTPLVLQFGSRTIIGGQRDCDANAIRDEVAWRRLFTGVEAATTTKEINMFMAMVKGNPAVWLSDGHRRRQLAAYASMQALQKVGVQVVPDLPNEAALTDLAGPVAVDAPAVDVDAIVAQVVEQLAGRLPTVEQIAERIPTAEGIAQATLREVYADSLPPAGDAATQG